MVYTIQIEGDFSSAHRLRDYEGKCENLHGHNWRVIVKIKTHELDKQGMVIDFGFAEKKLYQILKQFDHRYLNETHPFDKMNPTSENISRYLFDLMSSDLNDSRVSVFKVTVWEDSTSCATYMIDQKSIG
jgi:6-pyruvoyltetrahydropterin/6-carboxytetrahydropterin synthase